jgi:hypothetical protein
VRVRNQFDAQQPRGLEHVLHGKARVVLGFDAVQDGFKNLYENAAEGTNSTRLAPPSCFETDILFYLQHMPANYKGRLMLYPYDHTGGTPVAGGSVGGGVVLWNPKMPIGKTVIGKVWTDLGGVPLPAKGKGKFSGHMGRKTTASRSGALSGIISATAQMEATGHKSESAFAVYNHTSFEDEIARSAGIAGGREAAIEQQAKRRRLAAPSPGPSAPSSSSSYSPAPMPIDFGSMMQLMQMMMMMMMKMMDSLKGAQR